MQRGSLKVIKDRHGVRVWRAQWRENGKGRTRLLGRVVDVTRAHARAELDRILEPLNVRAVLRSSSVTLRRYVEDKYLVWKSNVWKDSTEGTTEQTIRTHILPELGNRPLASLDREELQELLNRKKNTGLSFSVVDRIHWQLTAIFGMAHREGAITIDPTGDLFTPKYERRTAQKTIISVEDIRRCQMVLEIRERLIYCLAVHQGLRPGEIVGLQLGDLRDDGLVHIERRIYRGKVDTPKSRDSIRPIALTATTAAIWAQYVELLTNRAADAWLFPSESGKTTVSYSNVYRRNIQPALESIGLGHVNFQILRRTWMTELREKEKDPAIRAKMAGHSVRVSENEYVQAKPDVLRRAAAKMEKHLQ